jgi:hypothetical protein
MRMARTTGAWRGANLVRTEMVKLVDKQGLVTQVGPEQLKNPWKRIFLHRPQESFHLSLKKTFFNCDCKSHEECFLDCPLE